jgi:hypothetical protein
VAKKYEKEKKIVKEAGLMWRGTNNCRPCSVSGQTKNQLLTNPLGQIGSVHESSSNENGQK